VLFVCTANVLDTIPGPLLDRMEVIRLSGYTADEKTAIARRYLEGQCRGEAGVPQGAVGLEDGALDLLIQEYCRWGGGVLEWAGGRGRGDGLLVNVAHQH
jgi:Lon-like ATP-dependent protease